LYDACIILELPNVLLLLLFAAIEPADKLLLLFKLLRAGFEFGTKLFLTILES
jgi:hypothetical protein